MIGKKVYDVRLCYTVNAAAVVDVPGASLRLGVVEVETMRS